MRTRFAVLKALALTGLLFHLAGCSKSSTPGSRSVAEEKITGSPSDPPVALQAQWNPSNRCFFRFDTTTTSEFPRRDQPTPVRQETTLGLDYSVAVTNLQADGGRVLDLEIRSVQLETATDDQRGFYFDSENRVMGSDGSPLAEGLRKILGTHLNCQLSSDNKVVRLDGVKELLEKMGGAGGRDRSQGAVRRMLNPQLFKQLLELTAGPDNPVRIGESWMVRNEVSAGFAGSLAADLTYTFKGWQKREQQQCALLEAKGKIKVKPGQERGQRGFATSIESGTITGKTWFNPAWGFPQETVLDQVLTGKGTGRPGRGTNAEPRTFTTTFRQHTVIKLVEVRPVSE